ncbi:hypothetical protein DFH08DRAFT_320578 [Mycena albidolilacea]|uniref:Cytochrome P450 n=1 Tax=Mycena albidolilacea TaxID=1033008 RepID=A0AAD6ZM62_9AGAR|nr:hypothetical protein DFH08DRAFT_320578 [Mycena albidolilacea]
MHLPKDSIVIPNVWHMLHDQAVFPNPMKFDPDRYRKPSTLKWTRLRIWFSASAGECARGRLSERVPFLRFAATLLATCDIFPAIDEHGNDIIPDVVYSSGSLSFPSQFDCIIKPRSENAYELLSDSAIDAPDSSLVN